MKKEKQKNLNLNEEIEFSSGINIEVKYNQITMKKENKEISRKFSPLLKVSVNGNKIVISSRKATKKEKKIFGSLKAHVRNMIQGLDEGFKYKLQAVSVHFPITLKVDEANNKLLIKNFLGEKKDRVIRLISGVNIKINKDVIELESADIEKAGLVASNIEKGTKIRFRDRRIFQDGIFITEKPGRKII